MTLAHGGQGFRYFQAYGRLEFILNNLQPVEEAQIVGRSIGAILILGKTTPGDTVTLLLSWPALVAPLAIEQSGVLDVVLGATSLDIPFSGNPPYALSPIPNWNTTVAITDERANGATVSFGTPAPANSKVYWSMRSFTGASPLNSVAITATASVGDDPVALSNKLAVLALQNPTLISAGFMAVTPYGTGPFAASAIPVPQVSFFNAMDFTIGVSSTGNTGAAITARGGLVADPKATVDPSTDPPTVLTGFVPILNWLEGAIIGSTDNLDTAKADVWTARADEPEIRVRLYNWWRKKLAMHLELPLWEESKEYGRGVSMAMI